MRTTLGGVRLQTLIYVFRHGFNIKSGCWGNGHKHNIRRGATSSWNLVHRGRDGVSKCVCSSGSERQCPVKCPCLSFCRTFTLRQLMPSTSKATHSLLNSSPSTPRFGQFGRSAGVCVSICVRPRVRVLDGLLVRAACMHVYVCAWERGVYLEGRGVGRC